MVCSGSASAEGRRALSSVSKRLLPWQVALGCGRSLVPYAARLAKKLGAGHASGLKLCLRLGRRVKRKPRSGLKRGRRLCGQTYRAIRLR